MKVPAKSRFMIILSRTHSEHLTLTSAKQALAKIKLKKDEVAVLITPKGERKHERQAGKR